MVECKEYNHKRFGIMEVIINKEHKSIHFPEKFIRKCLDVRNKDLPNCSDMWDENTGEAYIYLFEVFEYIKYSKCVDETRHVFNEWLEEIILDCAKLI
ncbi:MAG: hypothetical protein Q4D02_01765 [Clostridia bacterium]|nr:hypothetical protein [Clostridia bacterium]